MISFPEMLYALSPKDGNRDRGRVLNGMEATGQQQTKSFLWQSRV